MESYKRVSIIFAQYRQNFNAFRNRQKNINSTLKTCLNNLTTLFVKENMVKQYDTYDA